MKNIFITGASGFAGSWLLKSLLEREEDYNITVLLRNKPIITNTVLNGLDLSSVRIITGDITNSSLMEYVLSRYEIDTVFNFAANAVVRICENTPLQAFTDNVYGSACVLEAARKSKTVKHMIQMMSDKSYGNSTKLPYMEDETPLNGMRPYECTKSLIDMWCKMYRSNYNFPVTAIRSANLFGPGDPNDSRLIPQVCSNVAKDNNPWLYSGVADYVREFVYIEDAMSFMLNLVDKCEQNEALRYESYNLGTGNIYSIKDLVQKIINISGKDLQIEIREKELDFQEIPEQYLSVRKAYDLLGWAAEYVEDRFDESLVQTYNYYYQLHSKED